MNLAIIPARGGSKRLPGKNIFPLNGKPLICYTVEAAIKSGVYDTIIVSSDSQDILDKCANYEGVTCELRDPNLAKDTTKVIELMVEIAHRDGYSDKYKTISLLLPTCPFRSGSDIKRGMDLLKDEDDSVVSISLMRDPVQLSMTYDDGSHVVNPDAVLSPSPLKTGNTRSQDFVSYYRANGGFYISWIDKFKANRNYFLGRVKGCVIDQDKIVDIDTELDMKWAEFLINNNYIPND